MIRFFITLNVGQGLELADAALVICRDRGLAVHRFDIERDAKPEFLGRFDLCISMEVAEHLPEHVADKFVDLLCSLSDRVVLTAAVPGEEHGHNHVNERPNVYWIERFARRGYRCDDRLTKIWRSEWSKNGVAACFASSIMVFRAS